MRELRSIEIRCEIDTNKETLGTTVTTLAELVEWWNANAEDLGLPCYVLLPDEGSDE